MRGFGGAAGIGHRTGGLGRLAWLKETAEVEDLAPLAERLGKLFAKLSAIDPRLAIISDNTAADQLAAEAHAAWNRIGEHEHSHFTPPKAHAVPSTAYVTATAVNYCALAFPVVPLGHPDAAALSVAGRLLTHQVLHPKLREQGGAYGGGAGYQGGAATFALTSYRDPRLEATFADMRDSLRWLAECPDDAQAIKESVLGVLASLDAPGSPAGECRSRFAGDLKGTGPARLNAHRAAILAVTAEQVRAAAKRHLPPDGGVAAVICGPEAAARLGWETISV